MRQPRAEETPGRLKADPVGRESPGDTLQAAVRTEDLRKVYGRPGAEVVAVDSVTLNIPRRRLTAVMGPSGSGKSTLMHCMAGLDSVDSGRVFIGDQEITRLRDDALTRIRRDRIGFIFQAFNLLPTLTALENITLPMRIAGRRPDPDWLAQIVDTVGLQDRLSHLPTELSGGQQQRVACARALVGRPDVVFADEPTGNLDSRASAEVLAFLQASARDGGQSIVMVTHDPAAAGYADEVIFLSDGRVVDQMHQPTADRVLERMKGFGRPGHDQAARDDGNDE